MSVQLYIDYFSQSSRAVLAFCVETKIPFKVTLIRLGKQEQFNPDFLKISPWGTVPAITHNGLNIYESHAILAYLSDTFQVEDHWYPKVPSARVKVDTYLHWHHENIRKNFAGYIFNKHIGPQFYGTKFSQEINDSLVATQQMVLEYIDDILKNSFIAGTEKPTIGDLSCYCELTQMLIDKHDFSKYTNLVKWMDYMKNMKGITEAHKLFYKLLPRMKI